MDEARRRKIATALQQYRDTVSQHSFFLLRILLEGIEAQPDPPRWPATRVQSERIEAVQDSTLEEHFQTPLRCRGTYSAKTFEPN